MSPADHRTVARSRRRTALAVSIGLALTVASTVALTWPSIETHLAERALRQNTPDGLDFHTLSRIDGSTWRLEQVSATVSSWNIACDHVTATVNRRAVAGGHRRAEHVSAGTCTVDRRERTSTATSAQDPPHPRSSIESRITHAAEQALSLAAIINVDRLIAPIPSSPLTTLGLVSDSMTVTNITIEGQPGAWSSSMQATVADHSHGLSLSMSGNDLTASHATDLGVAVGPLHLRSDEASLLIRDDTLVFLHLAIGLGQAEDATTVHIERATLEPLASPPRLHIRGAAIDASIGIPPLRPPDGAPEPPPTLAEEEEEHDENSLEGRSRTERLAERARRASESRAALMDLADNAIDLLLQARALGHRADELRLPIDLTLEDLVFGEGTNALRLHRLHMAAGQRPRIAASVGNAELSLQPSEDGDWHLVVEQWPLSGIHPAVPDGLIDLDVRILGRLPGAPEEQVSRTQRGEVSADNASDDQVSGDAVSDEPLNVVGHVQLRGLVIDAPPVAPGLVGPIDLQASGQLNVDRNRSVRASIRSTVGLVQLDANLQVGAIETGERLTLDAGFTTRTLCQDAWRSIPEGLLPTLGHRGIRWSGTLRPRASVSYTIGTPTSFRMTVAEEPATCLAEWIRRDMDPEQLNSPDWVHHVQEGTDINDLRVGPGTEHFVPLERLPSYVPALMYLSEEMAFFRNRWISIPLLNRAIRMNLERGYYVYGGSTVSQQLVKNLFLTREKHLARKLEEAILVWVMEERVSKARILELYVNCIEFGPDIFGIRAASRFYFNAEPWDITPLEAAFLAALKPSPRIGGPWRRRGETPARGWFPRRIETLLERVAERGGHIPHSEIAHYAPFVVRFPHPEATHSNVRIPRPEGAAFIPFDPEDPERLAARAAGPPQVLELLPRPSLIRDGATLEHGAPNP